MWEDESRCARCGAVYPWRKSTSRFLRMTYCSFSCERKAEGFLIEDFDAVMRHVAIPAVFAEAIG